MQERFRQRGTHENPLSSAEVLAAAARAAERRKARSQSCTRIDYNLLGTTLPTFKQRPRTQPVDPSEAAGYHAEEDRPKVDLTDDNVRAKLSALGEAAIDPGKDPSNVQHFLVTDISPETAALLLRTPPKTL